MGVILLLLAASLWGTAFVAQKSTAAALGPFSVIFLRNLIGGIVLFAVTVFAQRRLPQGARRNSFDRRVVFGGTACGVALFLAMLAQQIGIADTTSGVSAFLTANYLLIVPIIGLVVGRRYSLIVWCGVALAVVGTYFICIDPAQDGFRLGRGEAWTLLCALLFAVQILCVDRFAPGTDVYAFSCVQQFTGVVCAAPFLMLPTETAHLDSTTLFGCAWELLYLGIVSNAIAYTCQNLGQTRTSPAAAAVVMSLESVFGALAGYVFGGERLAARTLCGCIVLFMAVLLANLPARRNVKEN